MLGAGGAVQLLSTLAIIVTNLILPVVMGRDTYGTYVVIVGASFLAQALVSSPADTAYLLKVAPAGSETPIGETGYMPAKALMTSTLAGCAAVGGSLPFTAVVAAMLLAGGQAAATGALHQCYRSGAGKATVKIGALMVVPTALVPLALGSRVGATAIGAVAGALSCLLGFALQYSRAGTSPLRGIPLGCREVARALGRQAWPSYLNSAVPWIAILRLGASRPTSTAVLKLSFSLMNSGQSLIPITSSIVLAATLRDAHARRRSTIRLLWCAVCLFGIAVTAGLHILGPFLNRVYGRDYPSLVQHLPLVASGVTACTVYWVFWPITTPGEAAESLGFLLGAVTIGSVGVMVLFGTSVYACLLIYVVAITAAGVLATLRSSLRLGALAFAIFATVTILQATS